MLVSEWLYCATCPCLTLPALACLPALQDVVRYLVEAMERQGCPVTVTALLNDTVGVLAAHR